jgi:hypothetical protein
MTCQQGILYPPSQGSQVRNVSRHHLPKFQGALVFELVHQQCSSVILSTQREVKPRHFLTELGLALLGPHLVLHIK